MRKELCFPSRAMKPSLARERLCQNEKQWPQDKWLKASLHSEKRHVYLSGHMTCSLGNTSKDEATYWASSTNLIVFTYLHLSQAVERRTPASYNEGFGAVLFILRLYYESPAPVLLTVSIVLSLIKSLEWKDLSNQTNSGTLCRGKQIKEKKNRVNQLFVKGVGSKSYHVSLFKRAWIRKVKKIILNILCIVFSKR